MTAPTDSELIDALTAQGGGRRITELDRRPYRYATSAPLEELSVRYADGAEGELILKDLARERLLGDAWTKPEFLHHPAREVEAYRRILGPAGIGPRCAAAVAEADPPRHWIALEKVAGVELWQVGELEIWERVARWLGEFHARFADRVAEVREANPHLLEHSEEWFRSWGERAGAALRQRAGDPRAAELREALAGYDEVASALAALPRTFVHGEAYPSNVLVLTAEHPGVYPIDWEMAAIGPGTVDLAALVGGWEPAERARLIAAYGRVDAADLARCRLHLALQWLGWSAEWRPPREHAHDWLGEALGLAQELGLD